MAATHTYIVSSATSFDNLVTVVGTVDTIPSTGAVAIKIQFNLNDFVLLNASGGISSVESYAGALMLQAAIDAGLSTPEATTLSQIPTGTFSLNGHTYVVSSATSIGNTATVTGTVDGISVTVNMKTSYLLLTAINGVGALESLVSQPMLLAANIAGLAQATVTQLPNGTFTL